MATQNGNTDSPTRWLSKSTLDELVRLADKSPKEFNLHFKRLDIRRKLQVRRYLLEQFTEKGHPIPAMIAQSVSATSPGRAEPQTVADDVGRTIGDAIDETSADDIVSFQDSPVEAQEEIAAESPESSLDALFSGTESDAVSTSDASETATLSNEAAEPGDESTGDEPLATATSEDSAEASSDEAFSLDDLFTADADASGSDSLENLFASDSGAEGDSGSLDDLFGGDSESSTATATVETAPATVAESAEQAYGVATPVDVPEDEIGAFLRVNPVFEGMEDDELEKFVSRITAVRYASDALICREGDPGNEMWIIREGGMRVSKRGQKVADLLAGAPVGEMSILDGKPRSTDLIAVDDPLLFVFTRDAYAEVFRLDMDAGSKLVSNIVGIQQTRLRNTTQQAIDNAVAAERAEGEIRRAKETQDLALPKDNNPAFGNSEFFVSFKGARGVSGDYYDFIEFPDRPNQLIVIMGDSTGHGLNAGLEMLLAKSASFTQIATEPSVEKITAAINNITCYIFGATMFMTFVCALIDREKHTIRYTNAGQQSHPYLYRMKSGEFAALESQIFQLGITPGVEYSSEEITYEDGDLLIFYSDGIIEAPYCPEGAAEVDRSDEYGDDRLREFISKHAHEEPQQITEALLAEAKAFCRFYDGFEEINGAEVDGDDITNIVIRLG